MLGSGGTNLYSRISTISNHPKIHNSKDIPEIQMYSVDLLIKIFATKIFCIIMIMSIFEIDANHMTFVWS